MENILKALKSRTVWTVVLMFTIGGIEAVGQFIPDSIETLILGVLSALAVYFKMKPSQNY